MSVVPRISEKALAGNEKKIYVFEVDKQLSKQEIMSSVEQQFEVKVARVRVQNVKGKPKMSNRKRLQPLAGKRSDIKVAYVTLKEGKITIVEGEE